MRAKLFRSNVNYQLIVNFLLLLLGIILFIFPANGLAFMTWLIGIGFCGAGLICGIIFALNHRDANPVLAVIAAVTLLGGALVMIFRMQISQIVLPIIIGLWVIASAVLCVMVAFGYRKGGANFWWFPLIAALAALVAAFLIFANLASTAQLIAYIIALYFIVFSAIRISEYFVFRHYKK